MKLFNRILCLIVGLTLLITTMATVQAATESLSIQPAEEIVRNINISAEDRVRITFKVLSDSSSHFRFYIVFPNGTTGDYGEATNYKVNFVSDIGGECELHFDNTNSSSSQLVTLNYEIEHYYFGIAEIPFLIIVIVFLLLCIVAGYIIMGKYS